MIRRIDHKPDCLKQYQNLEVFQLEHDGKVYGYIGFEGHKNIKNIHMEFERFAPSTMRELKRDWGLLKDHYGKAGVKTFVVSQGIEKDVVKWTKFVKLFGFEDFKYILISTQVI